MNAENEMLNQQGLSPYQHVFGRNPRVPFDVLQENPDAVSGTVALHDSTFAKSQAAEQLRECPWYKPRTSRPCVQHSMLDREPSENFCQEILSATGVLRSTREESVL